MSHVFWIVLLVVQGQGTVGMVSGTEAECQESREQVKGQAEIIALSECTSILVTQAPLRGEVGAK